MCIRNDIYIVLWSYETIYFQNTKASFRGEKMASYVTGDKHNAVGGIETYWNLTDQNQIFTLTSKKVDVQPLMEGEQCEMLIDNFSWCFIPTEDVTFL